MVHGGGGACVSHFQTTTHSFIKREKKNMGIKEKRDGEESDDQRWITQWHQLWLDLK
ncbi:hypothetical protein YC2023_015643 [Brassica napus]